MPVVLHFCILQLLLWAVPVTESKAAHLSNKITSPSPLMGYIQGIRRKKEWRKA